MQRRADCGLDPWRNVEILHGKSLEARLKAGSAQYIGHKGAPASIEGRRIRAPQDLISDLCRGSQTGREAVDSMAAMQSGSAARAPREPDPEPRMTVI